MRSLLFCSLLCVGLAAADPQAVDRDRITGADIDESLVSVTLTLDATDPAAADDHDDPDRPFASLAGAISAAKRRLSEQVSVKIRVRPGMHPAGEAVLENANGTRFGDAVLVVEGEDPESCVITGSRRWAPATWRTVTDGAGELLYYEHDWPYDFGNNGAAWGKYGPKGVISHRCEMIFLDGRPLEQVLLEQYDYQWPDAFSGRGTHTYTGFVPPEEALAPGTFGVAELDENGNRICIRPPVGFDWADATIDVAVDQFALRLWRVNNVVVRNLTVQHVAGPITNGAAVQTGPWWGDLAWRSRNILVEDCVFRWNNGKGVKWEMTRDVTMRRSRFVHNGFSGFTAGKSINLLIEDCETSYNNWRGHRSGFVGWAIGGVKMGTVRDLRVRRHRSIGNLTRGFWLDVGCRNCVFEDFVGVGNIRNLFFEISPGPIHVERALLAHDAECNLLIANAGNVTMVDSILYGAHRDQISYVCNERTTSDRLAYLLGESDDPDQAFPTAPGPVLLRGCVLQCNEADQALQATATGSPQIYQDMLDADYHGRDNCYNAPTAESFGTSYKRNVMRDFDGWVERTDETGSRWLDPGFRAPESGDFRLRPDSPLLDRAGALPLMHLGVEERARLHGWRRFNDFRPSVLPHQVRQIRLNDLGPAREWLLDDLDAVGQRDDAGWRFPDLDPGRTYLLLPVRTPFLGTADPSGPRSSS